MLSFQAQFDESVAFFLIYFCIYFLDFSALRFWMRVFYLTRFVFFVVLMIFMICLDTLLYSLEFRLNV